ncbi:hypothetical protein B296_00038440 [Ensete ventricosum]|uniref:Uncharacterized protein n=1 Tax=Ensete ventricosum TaxID=4639 RepID=A0A426ZWG1_ENSVE|nr:hypothetical protein B296_00038440 [Ensete ventricosum]
MRCGDPESVTEPDPARPDPDRANRIRLPLSISMMKTTLSRSPLMIAAHWRRHQGIRSGAGELSPPCSLLSVVIDLEGLRRRKRSSLVVEGLVPDGSRGYHDRRGWSSEIRLCAYRLEMVFERSYILFECMCACSFRLFVDNVENTMLDFYG